MVAATSRMLGLWMGPDCLELRDLPVPEPPPGWALIRMRGVGVCGTDLNLRAGYAGFSGVPGHEFVGEVERGSPEWIGERVVGDINVGCGACARCDALGPRHCERRRVLGIRDLGGAFAEYLTLPEANLHRVPESLADEDATFVEPLAAAMSAVESCAEHDEVLVVGDGRLGHLVVRALLAASIPTTVLGRRPDRFGRLEAMGARAVSRVDGRCFPAAIECSGSPSGHAAAIAAVRPRGTVVLKSTFPAPVEVDVSAVVVHELRLVGSRCGDFTQAIAALEDRRVIVADLVEAAYPLRKAPAALEHADREGVLKVLIKNP